MEPRCAVVLFPPAPAVSAAEEFRRIHDPLFLRIPAHVTVVSAFGWRGRREAEKRIGRALDDVRPGSFPATLCGVGRTKDGVVFVKVEEGAPRLSRLHEALTDALGPPPDLELPPFVPVLGVGRTPGAAEAAFLQRQVAGHLPPARFSVETLSLVEEDGRGIWHERVRLEL